MIKIEITDSSTPFLIGLHFHHGNLYTIGHKSTHNLVDPKCQNLELSVSNDKLYIENKKNGFFYKVNGKKISGKKSISQNDEINFSSVSFRIIEFKYSHIDHLTDTEDAFKKRISDVPELEEIFHLIEKDFIHLEKIKYDEK